MAKIPIQHIDGVGQLPGSTAVARLPKEVSYTMVAGLIGAMIYAKSDNFLVRLSIGTLIGIWLFITGYAWVTGKMVMSVINP